jgi:single-strand DNA-binding protein
MASVNQVIIVGNLGNDPEVRYAPSGDAIATISVATTNKWKDRNTGEQKEETEWHRVTAFGRLGEIFGQYLKKGSSVYIQGRLKTDKYTDREGVERYATKIIAENMQMLGGTRGQGEAVNDNGGNPPQRQAAGASGGGGRPAPQQRPAPNFSDMDDDIPF